MTTLETISDFLRSPDWTESEKMIIKWQFRLFGDFHSALFNAIKLADEYNLDRLGKEFPVEVQGFRQWAFGDLGKRLRKAGLEI